MAAIVMPLFLGSVSGAPSACGSRRAFVDVGANDGQSLEAVTRSSSEAYTAYTAFELNPAFAPVLQRRLAKLPQGTLVQAAAWVRDGQIDVDLQIPASRSTQELQRTHGVVQNMTGSSLIVRGRPLNPSSKCARASFCSGGARRTSVRSIDLAAWLTARFCTADFVFLKVDVEGAEFELLHHLVRTGAANLIDQLAVEWHAHKFPRDERAQLTARRIAIESQLAAAGVKTVDWAQMYDAGRWQQDHQSSSTRSSMRSRVTTSRLRAKRIAHERNRRPAR